TQRCSIRLQRYARDEIHPVHHLPPGLWQNPHRQPSSHHRLELDHPQAPRPCLLPFPTGHPFGMFPVVHGRPHGVLPMMFYCPDCNTVYFFPRGLTEEVTFELASGETRTMKFDPPNCPTCRREWIAAVQDGKPVPLIPLQKMEPAL